MDELAVLQIIDAMDLKIDDIQRDNELLKNEVDDLKANLSSPKISQAVNCTCDSEQKWRSITLTFIEDQEKAFNKFKDSMETKIYAVREDMKQVNDNILNLRKQVH